MKVLLLTYRYSGSDGHSIVMNNVARALIKKNIQVVIAAYNFIKEPPKTIPKLRLSWKNTLSFGKISRQFDIIHNFQTLTSYLAIFSTKSFLFHYLGTGTTLQVINLKISSLITRKCIKKYFVSSLVSADELYKTTRRNSDVISLAISDVFFNANYPLTRKLGEPQLLTITRFMDYKKNEDLIFAFKELVSKMSNAHLQIIGHGPKLKEIKELIRIKGLESSISFIGLVEHESLTDYYNSCDVYISTSSKEAFPLPVLECMAVGKPVVLSDIPIHKEIIEKSGGGMCYKSGNTSDLFEKVMTVLKNDNQFSKAGKNYAKVWNIDNLGNRLLELYNQL